MRLPEKASPLQLSSSLPLGVLLYPNSVTFLDVLQIQLPCASNSLGLSS